MALICKFVKHVLKLLSLIYFCIKSDVITLYNYGNIVDDILVSSDVWAKVVIFTHIWVS